MVKHLPVLVKSKQQGIAATETSFSDFEEISSLYDRNGEGDGVYHSTVYLDNDSMDTYQSTVRSPHSLSHLLTPP